MGELFYHLAKEANDAGDPFPIWGTCNGFELLTVLSSKDQSRLTDCDSQDDAVPLNFLTKWDESDLFSSVRTRQVFPSLIIIPRLLQMLSERLLRKK